MAITTNTNLKVTNKVTLKALQQLVNNLVIASKATKQYEAQFEGAKTGDKLFIRRPVIVDIIEDSMGFVANEPYESTVTLAIDKTFQAPLKFNDTDLSLKIEDFSKRFIEQAMVSLANKIDSWVYANVINNVANTVGQYSTAISTATILAAKTKLDENGAPMSGRVAILTSKQNSSLANYQQTIQFNNQKAIGEVYNTGEMGKFANLDFYQSESSPTHVDGAWAGTPVVSATAPSALMTSGWAEESTLSVAGFTAGTTVNVGDVFSISGVYAYNPLTKNASSDLQQFVVKTAVSTATSAAQALVVSPALITSGTYKNVDITIAGNVELIKYSTSGTRGKEGLVFAPDGLAVASIKLEEVIGSQNKTMTDTDTGITVNYARGSDITQRTNINRLDVVMGMKVTRPEWFCRIRGEG
jgi:hypothetical protein